MDLYSYFDHPYWDTRKSRRPGKQYVNPYMPDLSVVATQGSEYGGQRWVKFTTHHLIKLIRVNIRCFIQHDAAAPTVPRDVHYDGRRDLVSF